MIIVVDANVLFSFFKRDSKVRELILDADRRFNLELKAPKLLTEELGRHKGEICEKAGISEAGFAFAMAVLKVFVSSVPDKAWLGCKEKAGDLLQGHVKDIPYIALSIKLNCPLWSNEKRLKMQSQVKVYSTMDLVREFGL